MLKQRGVLLLGGWTRLVQRAGPAAPVMVLVLAFFAGRYALDNLGMNTDTRDMLSAELPWRQLDREYETLFPQYDNSLLAVIEAPTPDQARDAAELLYQRLRREDVLFVDVYYARALPVFRESGLLYLDTAELQDLADNLAAMQPFLARLAREPSLAGLFSVLGAALEAAADGENIDAAPVLAQINAAAAAVLAERPFRVSWQQLMSGGGAGDDGPWREFILLQPRLDYGSLFPAAAALEKVRRLYEELGLAADPGAALRLTGKTALAHEELQSVVQGARAAMVLALGLVTLILLAGLGSLKLALAAVASLVVGLVFTAAFAALTVGRLNLISVAFAVLYIGLGVDFAIHYCLRYRELLEGGEESRRALEYTATSVGGALFLCAVSTAVGFFAFIPTDYRGIAELGWISGFGMFISFATTITVTPSLLSLAPAGKRTTDAGRRAVSGRWTALAAVPAAHAGKILGAAALLAAGSCLALTALRFDYNPLNLHAQDGPALKTFRALLADNSLSPWTAVLVAADAAEAAHYQRRFNQSPLVERVVSITDFIPAAQEEKLAVIDEAGLLLGDLGAVPAVGAGAAPGERLAAVGALREKLRAHRPDDPAAAALDENLARLLAEDDPPRRAAQLERLERAVLASLPGRLAALRESLNADFISLDNLAPALKERWLSADGRRRLEIYPKKDMQDNAALREFVRALQAVSPRVVGSPVLNLEAGATVPAAFGQAFLYAFIVITLMLCLLLERKRDALLVLAPLLLAALLTAAAAALMNLPLNFANVIALPLLLGMGVDSGIHLVHRFRAGLPGRTSILATSSARAVVVSGLTTMGGIGNLALSPHAGTAGMGKLLTLGIGITLVCMLLVLPALLAYSERRRVAGGRRP